MGAQAAQFAARQVEEAEESVAQAVVALSRSEEWTDGDGGQAKAEMARRERWSVSVGKTVSRRVARIPVAHQPRRVAGVGAAVPVAVVAAADEEGEAGRDIEIHAEQQLAVGREVGCRWAVSACKGRRDGCSGVPCLVSFGGHRSLSRGGYRQEAAVCGRAEDGAGGLGRRHWESEVKQKEYGDGHAGIGAAGRRGTAVASSWVRYPRVLGEEKVPLRRHRHRRCRH